MFKNRKFQLILLCVVMLSTASIFFHETLVARSFSWYLSRFSTHYLGGQFKASTIFVDKSGRIVFENPAIGNSNDENLKAAEAERLIVDYTLHPSKLQVDIEIAIDRPCVSLGSSLPNLREFYEKLMRSSSLPGVNVSISVSKGELRFQKDHSPEQVLFCDLDVAVHQSGDSIGNARFYLEPEREDFKEFSMKLQRDGDKPFTSQWTFHEMEGFPFLNFARLFSPALNEWRLDRGVLDGSAAFCFDNQGKPCFCGDLIVQKAFLFNEKHHFAFEVEEAVLSFHPGAKGEMRFSNSSGAVTLTKPASFVIYREERPFWRIDDWIGNLTLDPIKGLAFSFEGGSALESNPFSLKLAGEGKFSEDNQGFIDISLTLQSGEDHSSSMRLIARQLGALWNCAEVVVENFTHDEFSLVQQPLAHYFPAMGGVHLHTGNINISAIGYMEGEHLNEIKMDKIAVEQMEFSIPTYDAVVSLKKAEGDFTICCDPERWIDSLNGDLTISDGSLQLAVGVEEIWRLTQIHSQLGFRNGRIQKSSLQGEFAGLSGVVEIDCDHPENILTLHFEGGIEELKHLFPDRIRAGLEGEFSRNHVAIAANVAKEDHFLNVTGEILLGEERLVHSDAIQFGFSLKRPKSPYWVYWIGKPTLTFSSDHPFTFEAGDCDCVKRKGGIAGFFLSSGWFKGEGLSLKKYVAPFLPIQKSFTLDGIGDFEGNFEHKILSIHYQFNQLQFDHELFSFSSLETDTEEPIRASHYFDLEKGSHYGFIPLRRIDLYHKETDIVLSDLSANLSFDQKNVFGAEEDPDSNEFAVEGVILGGRYTLPSEEISLKDIQLLFRYDHRDGSLLVSDIEAALQLKKQSYLLTGDYLRFHHSPLCKGDFDFWIGDKSRDRLRLVGEIHSRPDDPRVIDLTLNHHLSHLGQIRPLAFGISLRDWQSLEDLYLKFNVELKPFFEDFRAVFGDGLPFLAEPHHHEGNFLTELQYDPKIDQFLFHAVGSDVAIAGKPIETFKVDGRVKDGALLIDELQMDRMRVSADISKDSAIWNVNFLGIRMGEELLVGLEGKFDKKKENFDGQVNLFQIDFGAMSEWPLLSEIVEGIDLSGIVKGTGSFFLNKKKSKWVCDALFNLSIRSWGAFGLEFKEAHNLSCHLISNQSIVIRNIETGLLNRKDKTLQGIVKVEKASYDFITGNAELDNCRFNIPVDRLTWLRDNLQQSFPDLFTPKIADILVECKTQGNFEGSFSAQHSNQGNAMKLNLNEGVYRFNGGEHVINNFTMEGDPHQLKVSMQYCFNESLFWLSSMAYGPCFDKGTIVLSDCHPNQLDDNPEVNPLRIQWTYEPVWGFGIESAVGEIGGFTYRLFKNEHKPRNPLRLSLSGEVLVDFRKSLPFFSDHFREGIEKWVVGSGYQFNGLFEYQKEKEPLFEKGISMQGTLKGSNCEFYGYLFDSLKAQIDLQPDRVVFREVQLRDRAVGADIPFAAFTLGKEGQWDVETPEAIVMNLKPSYLRETAYTVMGKPKPLTFKKIELRDVKGHLGCRESFTGHGVATFASSSRKPIQNTIFAIPAEVLTRIGLDLGLLQPVSGTVQFHLDSAKVMFDRFKDIYSDAKLSKFFLVNKQSYPSYIDFDGNLHLQIRMKQYNLVFKLAELLTITVGGTWQKPSFALQKQDNVSKWNDRRFRLSK